MSATKITLTADQVNIYDFQGDFGHPTTTNLDNIKYVELYRNDETGVIAIRIFRKDV